jgi:hypothetical protein
MQHSVKNIGKEYEKISLIRKDKNPFSAKGFFDFANENIQKYGLIRCGEDLLVSTWFSSDLITDYRATLNN